MENYSFADKNSNCVMIVSGENEDEVVKLLEEKVKFPMDWRMEELETDEIK